MASRSVSRIFPFDILCLTSWHPSLSVDKLFMLLTVVKQTGSGNRCNMATPSEDNVTSGYTPSPVSYLRSQDIPRLSLSLSPSLSLLTSCLGFIIVLKIERQHFRQLWGTADQEWRARSMRRPRFCVRGLLASFISLHSKVIELFRFGLKVFFGDEFLEFRNLDP